MTRKLFGTDGVRGRANTYPMTPEMALKLGMAVGRYFRTDERAHRVIIGKDTRRSGYMLETALTAGFTAVGMDTFVLGPVPTPAIGMLTRSMRADLGVMISASHNPHHDNGIKFFGPDGFKLSDEAEAEIEAMLEGDIALAQAQNIGSSQRIEDGRGRYVEFAKTTFPKHLRLDGVKVVVDCANGAAYKCAPEMLWELGADVIPVGVRPNGYNINDKCGSTYTQTAAEQVVAHGADIGIALDGDADRVMIIDEKGQVADGDQLMALIAGRWLTEGRLAQNTLVATVMSNLGLENYMSSLGGELRRTAVGDRYVVEEMRKHGFNLGGEQSGHIVLRDYVTTGDGMIAALQVLAAYVEAGKQASDLLQVFEALPQMLENVTYTLGQDPLAIPAVQAAIADGEARLTGQGRLLIRKSGTEPKIRVMAECGDDALMRSVVADIVSAVKAAL